MSECSFGKLSFYYSIEYVYYNFILSIDPSFRDELEDADILTDYAVEIRYPDSWLEPSLKEARESYEIARKVKEFVQGRLG